MKTSVRYYDPDMSDWLNGIHKAFGIQAVGVEVDGNVIYRTGKFDGVRDTQVIIQQKRWG